MAAKFVKPYRKNQRVKNGARDAEAILAFRDWEESEGTAIGTRSRGPQLLKKR